MNDIDYYRRQMWADLDYSRNYWNLDYETITREVMAIIDRYKEKEPDIMSPKKEVMKHTMD